MEYHFKIINKNRKFDIFVLSKLPTRFLTYINFFQVPIFFANQAKSSDASLVFEHHTRKEIISSKAASAINGAVQRFSPLFVKTMGAWCAAIRVCIGFANIPNKPGSLSLTSQYHFYVASRACREYQIFLGVAVSVS